MDGVVKYKNNGVLGSYPPGDVYNAFKYAYDQAPALPEFTRTLGHTAYYAAKYAKDVGTSALGRWFSPKNKYKPQRLSGALVERYNEYAFGTKYPTDDMVNQREDDVAGFYLTSGAVNPGTRRVANGYVRNYAWSHLPLSWGAEKALRLAPFVKRKYYTNRYKSSGYANKRYHSYARRTKPWMYRSSYSRGFKPWRYRRRYKPRFRRSYYYRPRYGRRYGMRRRGSYRRRYSRRRMGTNYSNPNWYARGLARRYGGGNSLRGGVVKFIDGPVYNSDNDDFSIGVANLGFANPTAGLSIEYLNLVQTGIGLFNRVGNKIAMKSIRIRGGISPVYDAAAVSASLDPLYLRFMVLYDRQINNTAPVVNTIIQSQDQTGGTATNPLSGRNMDNTERYKTIIDEMWLIPTKASAFPATAVSTTNGGMSYWMIGNGKSFQFDYFKRLGGLETNYVSTDDPLTVANISTGALYAIAYSNSTTVTGNAPPWTCNFQYRLRFTD